MCWFQKKAVEKRSEAKEVVDLSVGNAWEPYWHMIARLLDESGYTRENVERLRRNA